LKTKKENLSAWHFYLLAKCPLDDKNILETGQKIEESGIDLQKIGGLYCGQANCKTITCWSAIEKALARCLSIGIPALAIRDENKHCALLWRSTVVG